MGSPSRPGDWHTSVRPAVFPVVLAAALAGVLAGLGVVWAVGNSPAQPRERQ